MLVLGLAEYSKWLCSAECLIIYCFRRVKGPLACCVGRMLVGVEGSMRFEVGYSRGAFGVSVETAFIVSGVGVCFTGQCSLNLNFR